MKTFEGHIQGDKPVLVDFYTKWCGPCKLMGPVLQEVKAITGERTTVLKIDLDQYPYYSRLYNIYSIPTIILFHRGKIIWRKTGVASAHEILKEMDLHLQ
jgi:thioredoxin 1